MAQIVRSICFLTTLFYFQTSCGLSVFSTIVTSFGPLLFSDLLWTSFIFRPLVICFLTTLLCPVMDVVVVIIVVLGITVVLV